MKLQVNVLEARGLAARDDNGLSDPFVRLQLGSTKAKSATVYKDLNPSWNEEFIFSVDGSDDELLVVVWDEDRFSRDFLGQVKIPISDVLTAEKQTIGRQWYTLQRSEKSKFPVTGEYQLHFPQLYDRLNLSLSNYDSSLVLQRSLAFLHS